MAFRSIFDTDNIVLVTVEDEEEQEAHCNGKDQVVQEKAEDKGWPNCHHGSQADHAGDKKGGKENP